MKTIKKTKRRTAYKSLHTPSIFCNLVFCFTHMWVTTGKVLATVVPPGAGLYCAGAYDDTFPDTGL